MKYSYKAIVTGKEHFAQAPFVGWTQPTGLLGARYTMFQRTSGTLFIPRYLLSPQTRHLLPAPEQPETAPSSILEASKTGGSEDVA